MRSHPVISADSHVIEPTDLWTELIEPKYRERAPRVEERDGNEVFVVDGMAPLWTNSLGLMGTAGVPNESLREYRRHRDANPGGWDPHRRVEDMDTDGVDAEVLYCSLSMPLFQLQDLEYQAACFRAYNNWLADFCAAHPSRLFGIAMIPLLDVDTGIAELRRVAGKGLVGAAIPVDLAAGIERPYWSEEYDPFWAKLCEMNMPASLHTLTGTTATTKGKFARYATTPATVQEAVANLVEFGVLERFPSLTIVSVENDAGWIPNYVNRLDHAFDRNRHYKSTQSPLTMQPSEYVRRQVRLTFMDDKVAIGQREAIGVETLLWASDYPHGDSTWPKSRDVIDWQLEDVPEIDARKIVYENVADLYQLS